ncbi:MAG: hypothetical protein GF372_05200 [Candidatus Marinimicrobia bacterium]|nr:hypothetical protein [Candidatus Neomarinimicrobiota bacterium]
MISQVKRYYHTLKYLTLRQTAGRVWGELRRRLQLYTLPDTLLFNETGLHPTVLFLDHDPWNRSDDLESGRFTFLNQSEDLGWPVDWNPEGASLLWKFNLHYFNCLHLLDAHRQEGFCLDWIASNTNRRGIAWHPYPVSLRIINWCKADLANTEIQKSVYEQAAYLYRNTEFYHPANHYLENARALIFAGVYFQGAGESSKWLNKGLEVFRRELPEQLLDDGGYFELSPMYHGLMLVAILDVINILEISHPEYQLLQEYASKMADFLLSMTHPDGHISLFNDSTQEIAPPTEKIIDYYQGLVDAEPQRRIRFSDSGYYILANEDVYCVVDGGQIGPDRIPAHAHADIFSYELSISGKQFIVNSGVYEYAAGPMRQYNRGTRSHNTVMIDNTDQAEVWSSFRVARRYRPHDIQFTSDDNAASFSGQYAGYGKLIGDSIIHARQIDLEKTNGSIRISDDIRGDGRHNVSSFIHLHPEVEVDMREGTVHLSRDGIHCRIESPDITPELEFGWYSPHFGQKNRKTVIVFRLNRRLPAALKYRIVPIN